jgi:hypothetical protein
MQMSAFPVVKTAEGSLGVEAALTEINDKKGLSFDTNVVNACMDLITRKSYEFDSCYYESSLIFPDELKHD